MSNNRHKIFYVPNKKDEKLSGRLGNQAILDDDESTAQIDQVDTESERYRQQGKNFRHKTGQPAVSRVEVMFAMITAASGHQ